MTSSSAPKPLSFPPEIFAALTPVHFLLAHLAPAQPSKTPVRANGRTSPQFRTPVVNTNSLTHCNGSAVVRIGDTAAVCGVRAEILLSKDIPTAPDVDLDAGENEDDGNSTNASKAAEQHELASLNLLVPNIELATGCSPDFMPGNPPTALAQSLSQRLLSLLHSTQLVSAKSLRILYTPPPDELDDEETPDVPPKQVVAAYWTLYMDIVFISLDGNAFDAAWAALLAALRNTVLPRAWWDPDLEAVLCSDAVSEARALPLRGMPVASTFAVFEPAREKGVRVDAKCFILADPDAFEESVCKEQVTVVVDGSDGEGVIKRLEKSGGTVVDEQMGMIVQAAMKRWREWHDVLAGEKR